MKRRLERAGSELRLQTLHAQFRSFSARRERRDLIDTAKPSNADLRLFAISFAVACAAIAVFLLR